MAPGGGRTGPQAQGAGEGGRGGIRVEGPRFPYLVQSRGEGKIVRGVCVSKCVHTCTVGP